MPLDKKFAPKAKKVKAVSSKDLNADGTVTQMSSQEKRLIYEKEEMRV
jgi:hypothetical protein